MKNLGLLTIAGFIALTLGACSSDAPATDGVAGADEQKEGSTYVAFNVSLPALEETRSDDPNVTYEDGLDKEYAIHDATLYVYRGSATQSTYDYSIVEKVKLDQIYNANSDSGITSTTSLIAHLGIKPDKNYVYRALVIINANGKNPLPEEYATFREWQNQVWKVGGYKMMTIEDADGNDQYFYMTNAFMIDTSNSTSTVLKHLDLCEIPFSQFFSTEAEAEASTGVNIYVERGVAKLSMISNDYWQTVTDDSQIDWSAAKTVESTAANYKDSKIVFLNWMVSNTNGYSYPIHTDGEWETNEKGVANTIIHPVDFIGQPAFIGNNNRCNWSFTPRYYGFQANGFPECELEVGATPSSVDLTVNQPRYVLENCSDYTAMKKHLATRIVLKAKYQPAGTNSYDADGTFFMFNQRAYSSAALLAYINDNLPAGVEAFTADEVNFSKIPLSYSKLTSDILTRTMDKATLDNINAHLGITDSDHGIARYDKGYCYYDAYVRHLSDDVDGIAWTGGEYTKAHLGRYGVVRNNWYKFEIKSVTYPGTPDVPSIPSNEMIDGNDTYINVVISTNAWARHSQNVIL
jgi:hypothetical protein